jgi:hypothetical protein
MPKTCEIYLTDKIHRILCQPKMKLRKSQAAKRKKFRNAAPHKELPPARVLGTVIQSRILRQNTAKITMACVTYCCVPFQLSDKPAQCPELRSFFRGCSA